jgi:hypothetical protein
VALKFRFSLSCLVEDGDPLTRVLLKMMICKEYAGRLHTLPMIVGSSSSDHQGLLSFRLLDETLYQIIIVTNDRTRIAIFHEISPERSPNCLVILE